MILNVNVQNKEAVYTGNTAIVCGNSDYQIQFAFTDEWKEHTVKTARFYSGGNYIDVIFENDICNVPILSKTTGVYVGVFAGELATTTAAYIPCETSILCMGEGIELPPLDVYAQLIDLAEETKEKADNAEETANTAHGNASSALELATQAKEFSVNAEGSAIDAQYRASNAEDTAFNAVQKASEAVDVANSVRADANAGMFKGERGFSGCFPLSVPYERVLCDESFENSQYVTVKCYLEAGIYKITRYAYTYHVTAKLNGDVIYEEFSSDNQFIVTLQEAGTFEVKFLGEGNEEQRVTIVRVGEKIIPVNTECDLGTLQADVEIALGEREEGYSSEWAFMITQGETAYNVTLPDVAWLLGIAPTFAANTTTEIRLHYKGNTIEGVWN